MRASGKTCRVIPHCASRFRLDVTLRPHAYKSSGSIPQEIRNWTKLITHLRRCWDVHRYVDTCDTNLQRPLVSSSLWSMRQNTTTPYPAFRAGKTSCLHHPPREARYTKNATKVMAVEFSKNNYVRAGMWAGHDRVVNSLDQDQQKLVS